MALAAARNNQRRLEARGETWQFDEEARLRVEKRRYGEHFLLQQSSLKTQQHSGTLHERSSTPPARRLQLHFEQMERPMERQKRQDDMMQHHGQLQEIEPMLPTGLDLSFTYEPSWNVTGSTERHDVHDRRRLPLDNAFLPSSPKMPAGHRTEQALTQSRLRPTFGYNKLLHSQDAPITRITARPHSALTHTGPQQEDKNPSSGAIWERLLEDEEGGHEVEVPYPAYVEPYETLDSSEGEHDYHHPPLLRDSNGPPADHYQPLSSFDRFNANVATAVASPPSMTSFPDASDFTSRRPNASALPTFELPPLPLASLRTKFHTPAYLSHSTKSVPSHRHGVSRLFNGADLSAPRPLAAPSDGVEGRWYGKHMVTSEQKGISETRLLANALQLERKSIRDDQCLANAFRHL
jgi:hypothetical protein